MFSNKHLLKPGHFSYEKSHSVILELQNDLMIQ